MSGGQALDLVETNVAVAGHELVLLRPRDPEALLDEEAFAHDEFLPYWAELWPAAIALAEALPARLGGTRIVEVGCGLGLPSLVAAARGGDVTATDWAPDAISLLRTNAERNGLVMRAELRDWRKPWDECYDLALAADVLYEQRNTEPLRELLSRLAPEVLLGLAGRPSESEFLDGAAPERVLDRVVRLRYPRSAGIDGG